MAQTPLPSVDYTAREFATIKSALVSYLKRRFPDDFTDFTESQLGIAILEMVSYSYSILSFMLDRLVNETYLDTARERRSVIKLAALLGYKLSTGTAASVTLAITRSTIESYDQPILISKGTDIDASGVPFEIDQDYTLVRQGVPPLYTWSVNGTLFPYPLDPQIGAIQGETVGESFVANGLKFLEINLAKSPLITGSMIVTVASVTWTLVTSLALGDPSDPSNQKIYEVLTDENDLPSLRFGDGVTGSVPEDGSVIAVTYRIGGGASGNIAQGSIQQSINATSNNISVSIGVYNIGPATGGSDRESTDRARFFAPLFAKTTDRAVTYNDFVTLSNGYTDGANGVIAKAGVIADPSDGLSNVVTVYTWTENSAGDLIAGAALPLKNALYAFLEARRGVAVLVQVRDGVNVAVNVTAAIRVDPAYAAQSVIDAATQAVKDLFKESRVRFGNEARVSWIYDAISETPGVSWTHVTEPSPIVLTGTARVIESGSLGTQIGGPTTITLPTGRGDKFYVNYRVTVSFGTGTQTRRIIDYTSATGLAVVDDAWTAGVVTPGLAFLIHHPRRIRIASTDTTADDGYNNRVISIVSGTNVGETRTILDYIATAQGNGAFDKIAVVDKDWLTPPDATSGYFILGDRRTISSQAVVAGTITIVAVT